MHEEQIAEGEPFPDAYSNEVATFGDRVAAARERLGLSQERLARKLGVKTKSLQSWEEDRSEPRANKLQMLAGVLNVSIIWLMSGEGGDLEPALDTGEGADLRECLGELRSIRNEYRNLNERMGRLEKRLRAMVA
ncbi:MAG: multiprotein-bridging factor 1 family protein [Paracoccaceae bacterium]